MFRQTTLQAFKQLAQDSSQVAVFKEIPGDQVTPVSVFEALGELGQRATLLESVPASGDQARFSYIGIDPVDQLQLKDQPDCLDQLRAFHKRQHCASEYRLNGFVGGAVGFMAYDAVRQLETIPDRHHDEGMPDLDFMSYGTNISFDHYTHKLILSTRVTVTDAIESCYEQAMQRLSNLAERIHYPPCKSGATTNLTSSAGVTVTDEATTKNREAVPGDIEGDDYKLIINGSKDNTVTGTDRETVSVDIDDDDYKQIINEAKRYIEAGEIYQVVLSRRFSKSLHSSPFAVYRALRMVSPSTYLFYIDRGDYVITGASPEKLISVTGDQVSAFPIAGTRPLSSDNETNYQREQELANDDKECAEHVMLVDLARNDVGRVCEPGSVAVNEFQRVQRYSHVMHMTSLVTGRLAPGFDAIDALKAAFPAGTLSGAPKIRAMQIIDELENSRRGAYGGAVCFINNDGDLNSCITIRTAVIEDNQVVVRAGGGVVYDSDPQAEADETRHKARSVLNAIELAQGGLS